MRYLTLKVVSSFVWGHEKLICLGMKKKVECWYGDEWNLSWPMKGVQLRMILKTVAWFGLFPPDLS